MNGDFGELYAKLDKRISIVEEGNKAWRDNHDKGAESSRYLVREIWNKIKDLDCKTHATQIESIEKHMKNRFDSFQYIIGGMCIVLWFVVINM